MAVEFRPVEVTLTGVGTWNRARIDKKLVAVNRRLAKMGAPPAVVTYGPVQHVTERDDFGFDRSYDAFETVTVSGVEAAHGGWHPVASLDHTYVEGEALISLFPAAVAQLEAGAFVFPQSYRTSGAGCDLCRIAIDRNRTIVFRHDDGRWTQVGTSCVLQFFGVDPATVLWLRDAYSFGTDDDEEFGREARSHSYVAPLDFLAVAAAVTTAYGFVPTSAAADWGKQSTRDFVSDLVHDRMSPKHRAEALAGLDVPGHRAAADEIVAWVLAQSSSSDFMVNAQLAVRSHKVGPKTEGILAALPSVHARSLAEKAEREAAAEGKVSGHVGEVGKMLSVTGEVVTRVAVETTYGMSLRLSVRTEAGDVVTTFGSGDSLWKVKVGDTVDWRGKVKAHTDDRYGKQTECKMVKVVKHLKPVPADWRKLSDDALQDMAFETLDDRRDEELAEEMFQELRDRSQMRDDPRFAEAMGAPWLVPS
jgi:hypothetical protein